MLLSHAKQVFLKYTHRRFRASRLLTCVDPTKRFFAAAHSDEEQLARTIAEGGNVNHKSDFML